MKTKLLIMLLAAMTFFSASVFAGLDCKVIDAHVVSIMPWTDGAVFINLDKPNNCGCTISTRFGFYPSDPQAKNFLALALTAFATQSKISIFGNAGCSVQTNTSAVYTLILGGGQ